jgi:steroid 5-alpha reductase family enzyme
MEKIVSLLISGGIVLLVLFTLTWVLQLKTKNAGIVDSVWAISFPILVILYFVQEDGYLPRELLIITMVMIWGLRLASYLFFRTIGQTEDPRYTTLRQQWGEHQNVRMLLFYNFQALLVLVLSLPFALIIVNPDPEITWIEMAGAGVWLVGVVGESVADQQLKNFKANASNKGKVCDTGLWNYSRHPNYFFEWVIWVAYCITAFGSPWGFLSILSPVLMLYFLLRVTGIPYTESQILKSRGAAYVAYQETTSAFIPLPKKKLATR